MTLAKSEWLTAQFGPAHDVESSLPDDSNDPEWSDMVEDIILELHQPSWHGLDVYPGYEEPSDDDAVETTVDEDLDYPMTEDDDGYESDETIPEDEPSS